MTKEQMTKLIEDLLMYFFWNGRYDMEGVEDWSESKWNQTICDIVRAYE